ncbi:hypothetical protein ES332_D06G208900v1 [Gossypium tomentosum]|uniref:Origin recognition complex subunit 2 n=1 Tax=Gossypium tomentosum TaxID=34277 RepID=A0A5D2KM21_GOSTO|nr:hypothetical protein ES332_D06G208900v1 [Gossypium tomentosum]
MGSSKKKFARKLSEINVVDEQELREASANIEPKHHNDVADLINSYKSLYPKWVFDLSKHYTRDCVDFVGWKVYGEESCFLEATSGLLLVTGGHYIFYCYPCFVIDLLTALKYWMYDICYSIASWIYEHVC